MRCAMLRQLALDCFAEPQASCKLPWIRYWLSIPERHALSLSGSTHCVNAMQCCCLGPSRRATKVLWVCAIGYNRSGERQLWLWAVDRLSGVTMNGELLAPSMSFKHLRHACLTLENGGCECKQCINCL